MASPAPRTPSTPASQKQQVPITPNGAWKHPRFEEITRRQHATTFDERNAKIVAINTTLLVGSFTALPVVSLFPVVSNVVNWLVSLVHAVPYHQLGVVALRLVFVWNIAMALMPLVRRYYPDDLADIPLTPSQRQSMGLDPNVSTPQTPGSAYVSPNYVTPPRYQQSSPRASFSNSGDRTFSSGSPRASFAKSTSNSPFTVSNGKGSPLFQKALGGSSAQRRLSYDSRGSPLDGSLFGEASSGAAPGTPTPGTGKASVGLNNKWLYEKRRDSPRNSFYS
ncbi:hypothetical protein BS50DRAFT_567238 [Corynespora cassiicola Philippines]|uniref:Nuclear pore complex component n=1 Tax=Corynespora cassiicola Philippines TaxID=1448308 RepID=A0A2T2P9Q5_CORCC|nr:hypothetical protein BS50DRAFT_567238 [Corynespora cassiicola Philippines]